MSPRPPAAGSAVPPGLPLWRVAPGRAALIRRGDLALAWAVALLLPPLLALALRGLGELAIGPGALLYPGGALRGFPAALLLALLLVPGALLPLLPLSLLFARPLARRDLAGVLVPPLAALLSLALLAAVATVAGGIDGAESGDLPDLRLALPVAVALAGLAFWLALRLRRPEAFRPARG
jgi:hypothetical protein